MELAERISGDTTIGHSLAYCQALEKLAGTEVPARAKYPRAILHWVRADNSGKLYRVKIKDPSFVNWPALSFALLKNIVPDFPLCNKSFNQSYSGNDL